MRILFRALLFVLPASMTMAASSLENARRAQAMLGSQTWSHVVEIQNRSSRTSYPARVHALIFEEGGILWFYTDLDGTQSLSLYRNRLAQEKSDLGTLLTEIDAGFTHFIVLPDQSAETAAKEKRPLPNGCFIESVQALHERVARGESVLRPRLLSCYVDTSTGRRGHTVLTYLTPEGFFLLDPQRSSRPQLLPAIWVDDSAAIAATALNGLHVAKARWIPLAVPPVTLFANAHSSGVRMNPENATPRLMQ